MVAMLITDVNFIKLCLLNIFKCVIITGEAHLMSTLFVESQWFQSNSFDL